MLENIWCQLLSRFFHVTDKIADVHFSEFNGNTFAIQNIALRKNLRPFRARKNDGNPIILYVHHSWKCLTWRLVQTAGGSFRLINYYTGKTLSIQSHPDEGAVLVQNRAVSDEVTWEFTEVTKGWLCHTSGRHRTLHYGVFRYD